MITYQELTEGVALNIKIDYNETDLARFNVVRNLNLAVLNLINKLPSIHLSEVIRTSQASIVSGTQSYQWPVDFLRFVKLWVRWAIEDEYIPADLKSSTEAENIYSLFSQATEEYPLVQIDAERGFTIFPIPHENVVNGIRLRYVFLPPEITDTQDCILDEKWKSLILYDASAMSAAVEGRKIELSNYWLGLYERELNKLMPKVAI